jgi:hypothetical protein
MLGKKLALELNLEERCTSEQQKCVTLWVQPKSRFSSPGQVTQAHRREVTAKSKGGLKVAG